MDTEDTTEKAPGTRLVFLIALLALAVDSAAAFSRVFEGTGPAVRLGLAAGTAVVLASLMERRHVLLATVVSAAGLVMVAGFLLFRSTLWHHLPTAATLRAAARAWSRIGEVSRSETSPARPLTPLFLAGLTAVWAAAFSAHALAVRARSAFLALLPPAALLGFPSILLSGGARPLYVLTFLLAALALLFADALRRVGQWGPLTIWQGRRRVRLGSAGTLRGARWLGVSCVAIAILIPGVLPGYTHPGLVDVHSAAAGFRVSIDPIVDIKPQLLQSKAIPLFQVHSPRATYWRLVALDTFDGQRWDSSNLYATDGTVVSSGPLASTPAIDPGSAQVLSFTQTFSFQDLTIPWLPAAYDPVQVSSGAVLRYDPRASVLVNPDETSSDYSYQVRSRLVLPTPAQLDDIPSLAAADAAAYLRLPQLPADITDLAHRIADPMPTPYQKILAIQSYLHRFRYDESVPAGHDVNHMEYFLFTSKAGYCEQFAGTMAVMLRAIGIPARVAVGFTSGQPTPDPATYEITTDDAHAWVEVLFPKYGWIPFEPTPGRTNPATASIDFPAVIHPVDGGNGTGPQSCKFPRPEIVPGACGSSGQPTPGPSGGGHRPGERGGTNNPSSSRGHKINWRALAAESVASFLLLALAAIPLVKAVRRRQAIRRARGVRARVLASYEVLASRARDIGLGRGPSETLWEYRTRLRERIPGLEDGFDRLTALSGRAAYSDRAITEEQAAEAESASKQAWKAIARSVDAGRRIAGWFWVERRSLFRWA